MNEKELIKKCKEGYVEAFEELISSHQTRVYNIALKMLKNEEDAYDASQDALLKAFKYIKNFKEESSFSTWIYRITVNVCLDMIKKNKEKRNVISIEQQISLKDNDVTIQFEDKSQNVMEDILKNERKKVLHEAIDALPAHHREMIILRDIEGFSYEEIAQITKNNAGTVKSKINRARNALKKILTDNRELFFFATVLLIMRGGLL